MPAKLLLLGTRSAMENSWNPGQNTFSDHGPLRARSLMESPVYGEKARHFS